MIQGFKCGHTERLFTTGRSKKFVKIVNIALRKLDMLDAAQALVDLRIPPGNRLEELKGDRAGQYSIRINNRFRLCFVWTGNGPDQVEILDYH